MVVELAEAFFSGVAFVEPFTATESRTPPALAGALGGGGLGQFAITYGYQRYDWTVTAIAVVTIIIIVQLAQFLGNWLARRALRR